MGQTFYKNMFLAGAIWNVLGGAILLGIQDWVFSTADLNPPDPPLYFYGWIALFMTFGIGYYMVSRDLFNNKNIVILGIIGKLVFSGIFIYYVISASDLVPMLMLVPVIGDLVFVALFGMFLNYTRKLAQ